MNEDNGLKKNDINTIDQLIARWPRLERRREELARVTHLYPLRITPYYAALIDRHGIESPPGRMFIPDPRELRRRPEELDDPIGDREDRDGRVTPALISHRYPDRALLFASPRCAAYCRYCFRCGWIWRQGARPSDDELTAAVDYIRATPSIREAILTGGDPLMLEDDALIDLLERLRRIERIRVLRIHTRMPAVSPGRVTAALAERLRRLQPLWVVCQINHALELTDEAAGQLDLLVDHGIPVLNQAVLLNNVNDSANALADLGWRLIERRIKPYYLHHLDLAPGRSHFRVDLQRGIDLIRRLRGAVPGYAIPHFMLDLPGGHGKVSLDARRMEIDEEGGIRVESPFGCWRFYPTPGSRL